MKIVAQILFSIFFLFFFLIVVFSSIVKFQLLNYNFWTSAFGKNDVYTNLSSVVKESFENQVGKGGGNKNDIVILTDLITPENTKAFVNTNLLHLVNFMNGKSKELKVYIPIDKIPKEILPNSIAKINQEMTVDEIATKFNIVGLQNLPLEELSKIGLYDYYVLMLSVSFAVIFLVLNMLVVAPGKKFIAPGISVILSGFITILLVQAGNNISSYIVDNFTNSISVNKIIVLTVMPPVIGDIVKTLTYVEVGLVLTGILIFFVKRPE